MARTIWKGSISFGLVNIPVALYPGEQHESLDLTMLDKRDMSPVGYKRVNKRTGKEVAMQDIVKGYEYENDQYVVLSDEELKRANVKATQSIDIIEFVDADAIPFMYFDRPYYIEPLKKIGEKGYVLLRDTLSRSGKVGIAYVVLRARQHLAMLAPMKNLLVLNLLRYHHELRQPTGLNIPKEVRVSAREIDMARRLFDDMAAKWDPSKYKDEYRDDVMKLVERKVAAGKTLEIEEPAADGEEERPSAKVIDFMTLLKRSIEEKEKRKPQRKRKAASSHAKTKHRKRA